MKRLLLLAASLPFMASAVEVAPIPKVTIVAKRDAEWASYRHAYTAAAFFAKFTDSRPLIQAHMQIRPNRKDLPMDGLHIQLESESGTIEVPVDRIGRATIPMLKQAYEDDAVLRLNRRKGDYHFSGRYSIKERADGVYRVADLRAACEQLLDAQRQSGYRLRVLGKDCVGVRFAYALSEASPQIAFKDASNGTKPLAVSDAQPFENNTMGLFKVALLRFADWPEEGEVIAHTRPLAVGTIYE